MTKDRDLNSDCVSDLSTVYIQYTCDFKDVYKQSQKVGAFVAMIMVISCWAFNCTIYYLKKSSKLQYKNWDVKSVTVADFTVQI